MTDIITYRSRIGLFSPKIKKNKFLYKRKYYEEFSWNKNHSGKKTLFLLQSVIKLVMLICLLCPSRSVPESDLLISRQRLAKSSTQYSGLVVGHAEVNCAVPGWWAEGVGGGGGRQDTGGGNIIIHTSIVDHNFEARYLHGNIQKQKGILNMHLNIRSLRYKVYEVKQLIKQHNPSIFGLSECEIKRDRVDEKDLKVPGYDILFPKSWAQHGYARVIVYVKKTFKYQQIPELEDDVVQSIWLKGSQRNSKDIYFCHGYREHLSGAGTAAQRNYLATFLEQWEAATQYGGRAEPNEVHISGDMNIDVYQERWLHPDYHLVTLSRLIKAACDLNNFHQLVKEITRLQFNSVSNSTSMSTIDHVYTNAKFRCSDVKVTSFGDSDHDLISYTRCMRALMLMKPLNASQESLDLF